MTKMRTWDELRSSGLLWLINRALLHPRGYALGIGTEGWCLLGDGSEPWRYEIEGEDDLFAAAEATLGRRPH